MSMFLPFILVYLVVDAVEEPVERFFINKGDFRLIQSHVVEAYLYDDRRNDSLEGLW
jgi:hypothetical protein